MVLLVLFLLFGIGITVALLRLRDSGGGRKHTLFLSVSVVPLLITFVLPVPFVLGPGGPSASARRGILSVSRIGIALSFVLLAVGLVLLVRAAIRGDRRSLVLLSVETALAAAPALLFLLAYGLLR